METRNFDGKQEDMKNISLPLGKDLHNQLRRYAFEHDKSISLIIEEAIKGKMKESEIEN